MGNRLRRLRDEMQSITGGSTFVEIFGHRELVITGCTALMDFDDKTVCVKTVSGDISVKGSSLSVSAFRADLLCVCGRISSVEFSEGEE